MPNRWGYHKDKTAKDAAREIAEVLKVTEHDAEYMPTAMKKAFRNIDWSKMVDWQIQVKNGKYAGSEDEDRYHVTFDFWGNPFREKVKEDEPVLEADPVFEKEIEAGKGLIKTEDTNTNTVTIGIDSEYELDLRRRCRDYIESKTHESSEYLKELAEVRKLKAEQEDLNKRWNKALNELHALLELNNKRKTFKGTIG